MHRHRVLSTVALLGLVLIAGCATQSTKGHLTAEAVTEVLDDAEVILASDERIADAEPVQTVVNRATTEDGELATVEIEGSEADDAIERLQMLPYYDENDSDAPSGYYIEYQRQVVVVNWVVQD